MTTEERKPRLPDRTRSFVQHAFTHGADAVFDVVGQDQTLLGQQQNKTYLSKK